MGLFHRSFARVVDGTATALARSLMLSRSLPTSNTLAELGLYEGYSIDELLGDVPPVPDAVTIDRRGTRRFKLTDIEFDSHHEALSGRCRVLREGPHACNGRAHARWIQHRRPRADGRPRTTLLFLHSWMAPVSRAEDLLLLPYFARKLDVDILSLHLPYHGRRKPEESAFHGEYFWTADLVRTFEALRQSIFDARSLIAWLRQQQGDQPAPIGVMGVSLGGMVALGLACFEPTLDFAIPVSAHLDLAGVLADAALLVPMRKDLARHGWGPEDVHAYTHSLVLNEALPVVPKERLLFVVGRYDRILHTDRTVDLWQRWGRPPIHWFEAGHLGILTHIGGILGAARTFIDDLSPTLDPPRVVPRTVPGSSDTAAA